MMVSINEISEPGILFVMKNQKPQKCFTIRHNLSHSANHTGLNRPHNFGRHSIAQKQNSDYTLSVGRDMLTSTTNFLSNPFSSLALNQTFLNSTYRDTPWKYQESRQREDRIKNLISDLHSKQKKLKKDAKEAWLIVNSRAFPSYIRNLSDAQDRQVYRSRKKDEDSISKDFHISIQPCICFDGTFPKSRLHGVMVSIPEKDRKKQLYLVGGLSSEMGKKLHFHQYDFFSHQWKAIGHGIESAPLFNLSQHTAVEYNRRIYIIGGIAVFPSQQEDNRNQRFNIPFISCFNLDKQQWTRINWSVYLRAHATACFGRYAIIQGGISEDSKHSNKVYVLDLQKKQAPTSVAITGLGLAFHKIVSTDVVEEKVKNCLKVEGLLCFGGRYESGQLNSQVYHIPAENKHNQLFERFCKFEWNVLACSGKSPQARYKHSANILNLKSNSFQKRAFCVVVGGMKAEGVILNDIWLLDLFNLEWMEVDLTEFNSPFMKYGAAGHCAQVSLNQVYIFGGINSQRMQCTDFWTIGYDKMTRKGKIMARRQRKENHASEHEQEQQRI